MITMADILNSYGPAYIAQYHNEILPSHQRAINDIMRCRTPALGGHVYKCPDHDQFDYKYHSCMNRHCPQCQNDQATAWLNKEQQRLINVRYFLVTFTLPSELRPVARSNQKLFYHLLFSASWHTMQKIALNPRWLGGQIGALGVLHTWTKTMTYHPHVHYLVPAGGLNVDNTIWVKAQDKFFLPVKALSRIFRALFRYSLKQLAPELFRIIPKEVWHKNWVVYAIPAGNGHAVLKYFAPYVFRVAISNKRIIKLENEHVTFLYKHPETKRWTPMTLLVFEFIHRFLQHVLPRGLKKVRHFGFLSAKNKHLLALLQYKLGTVETEPQPKPEPDSRVPHCSICGKAMFLIEIVPPGGFALRINDQNPSQKQIRAP